MEEFISAEPNDCGGSDVEGRINKLIFSLDFMYFRDLGKTISPRCTRLLFCFPLSRRLCILQIFKSVFMTEHHTAISILQAYYYISCRLQKHYKKCKNSRKNCEGSVKMLSQIDVWEKHIYTQILKLFYKILSVRLSREEHRHIVQIHSVAAAGIWDNKLIMFQL